jgi:hypothetical protein
MGERGLERENKKENRLSFNDRFSILSLLLRPPHPWDRKQLA